LARECHATQKVGQVKDQTALRGNEKGVIQNVPGGTAAIAVAF
jgi:hypothetical protein